MSATAERLRNPHPGDILREESLEPMGMTVPHLAAVMGALPVWLEEFAAGRLPVTEELAVRLEAHLGCSAQFWHNLQAAYDAEEERRAAA